MRVPTYESQIKTATPTIQTPRMPTLTTPSVIRGAFGEDVARANQYLGAVGQQIAEHLQQLNLDNQNKEILDRDTSFRLEMQKRLSDQETETINGVERPKGYLVRQLGQAKGSTDEFTQNWEAVKSKYLTGLNKYQIDKLSPRLDDYFISTQNKIITHEANQNDEDFKNSTASNLRQSYLDASTIREPKELSNAVDSAVSNAEPYYAKYDEATRKLKEEEIAGKVIKASVVSYLQDTADLESAQTLLKSVEDKISHATYNDIAGTLNTGFKTIENNLNRIRLENRIEDRYDKIMGVLDGTIDWSNSDELVREVARTDTRLAAAMIENIKNGKVEIKGKGNEDFMEIAENIFASDDREDITNFLVTALNDTKNISRERLAILVYAADKRNEELKKGETSGFWKNAFEAIKLLPYLSAPAVLSNLIKRSQKENIPDEKIEDVAKEEIVKQSKADNSERVKVKIKSTGRTGTILKSEFNSEIYTQIE